MSSYVDVRFCGRNADPAIEAAIHLWVARFASMRIEVHRATLTIEASGRRTLVCLTLELTNKSVHTVTAIHADAHVAIADAFRSAKQQLHATPPIARARAADHGGWRRVARA